MSTSISPDSSPTTVVVDIRSIAGEFFAAAESFYRKYDLKLEMNEEDAVKIITAMLDDILNHRFAWANPSNHMHTLLSKHFPFLDSQRLSKAQKEISNKFSMSVVDAAELKLNNFLDLFIPQGTWYIWTLRIIGSDMILQRGLDYRVYDWEQRMASGVWTR